MSLEDPSRHSFNGTLQGGRCGVSPSAKAYIWQVGRARLLRVALELWAVKVTCPCKVPVTNTYRGMNNTELDILIWHHMRYLTTVSMAV